MKKRIVIIMAFWVIGSGVLYFFSQYQASALLAQCACTGLLIAEGMK